MKNFLIYFIIGALLTHHTIPLADINDNQDPQSYKQYFISDVEQQLSQQLSNISTPAVQHYTDILNKWNSPSDKPFHLKVTHLIRKQQYLTPPSPVHPDMARDPILHLIWAKLLLDSPSIKGQLAVVKAFASSKEIYNPLIHAILLKMFISTNSIKLKKSLVSVLLSHCGLSAYSGVVWIINTELQPNNENYNNREHWMLRKDMVTLIAKLEQKTRVKQILEPIAQQDKSPSVKKTALSALRSLSSPKSKQKGCANIL